MSPWSGVRVRGEPLWFLGCSLRLIIKCLPKAFRVWVFRCVGFRGFIRVIKSKAKGFIRFLDPIKTLYKPQRALEKEPQPADVQPAEAAPPPPSAASGCHRPVSPGFCRRPSLQGITAQGVPKGLGLRVKRVQEFSV